MSTEKDLVVSTNQIQYPVDFQLTYTQNENINNTSVDDNELYQKDLLHIISIGEICSTNEGHSDFEQLDLYQLLTKRIDKYYDDIFSYDPSVEQPDTSSKTDNINRLHQLLIKTANKLFSKDPRIGFVLLFSFDYLPLAHELLSGWYKTNHISDEIITKLSNEVLESSDSE